MILNPIRIPAEDETRLKIFNSFIGGIISATACAACYFLLWHKMYRASFIFIALAHGDAIPRSSFRRA